MIGIVDYGIERDEAKSVERAFRELGFEAFSAVAPRDLDRADKIVLPGAGSFEHAVRALRQQGWAKKIRAEIERGKPFLGIGLGMQVLFQASEESEAVGGLGILPGRIRTAGNEVPPAGWNRLNIGRKSSIFRNTSEPYVYFAHSCRVETDPACVSALTLHGALAAAVERGNVYAVQFRPEKSGPYGLEVLKKFAILESRPREARRAASYRTMSTPGGWSPDPFPRH